MADTKNLRILVIDDELTQRMLVKEYLEDSGHQVTLSEDGKRGLKLAISTKPDIILLDYLLPHVDGNSVCKSLKSNPTTADIPVILVTASRESDVIDKGLAAGADDFVTKPVDWAYLSDRVINVVKKANEKLALTRMLQTQATTAPVQPPVHANDASEEVSRLEELLRHAERQLELAHKSFRLERADSEARHAEALAATIADVRSQVEAEQATRNSALADEVMQAVDDIRSECEAQVAAVKAAQADEIRSAVEQSGALWAAKLDALKQAHAEELRAERQRIPDDIAAFKAANGPDPRREAEEDADAAEKVRAAWSISSRAASAQATIAASIESLARAAQTTPGSSELVELERAARALKNVSAGFKLLAQAMVESAPSSRTPVQLAPMLEEVAAHTGRIAHHRRVDVRCDRIDPSLSVQADAGRLRYALTCLVSNAIRFTPAGGIVELDVKSADDGTVRLAISDNGLGIAPAKLQELRSCLDAPPATHVGINAESSGLGIPTVQALMRQMSGVLELTSKLGAGTRAEMIFPPAKRYHVGQMASA